MSRVYLHIGAPKTGTTFLQEVLFRNQQRLADNGVLYPGDSPAAHFRAVIDLRKLNFGGYDDPAAEGAWEALAATARSWRGPAVVISHELLAASKPPTIEHAIASLRPHDVNVVMTARDFGRQVPAVWQETLKNKQVLDYRTFLRQLMAYEGRSARVFWRQQDVAKVLGAWSKSVPTGQLHLVTVPPAGSSSTLIWERFCSVLGIDADGYDLTVERSNASLGLAEAELMRRINLAVDDRLEWPQFTRTVKFWFAEQLLNRRRDSVRAQVPDELREWFDEASATMVGEVRRRGYHVVGDLDDLTPAYGKPDAVDEPRPDDVLDAAAFALAELLVERAQPRQSPGQAMLKDVSGRLRGANRRRVLQWLPEWLKAWLRRAAGR